MPSHQTTGHCWYDTPELAWKFSGLCSRAECQCDAVTAAVGREFLADSPPAGMAGGGGSNAAPACVAAVQHACGADATEPAKCQACLTSNASSLMTKCGNSQSQFQAAAIDICYGGAGGGQAMAMLQVTSKLARLLNGTWYRCVCVVLLCMVRLSCARPSCRSCFGDRCTQHWLTLTCLLACLHGWVQHTRRGRMRARLTTNWRRQLLLAAGQEHATRERFVCEQQRHCGREGAQPELLGAVPAADQPILGLLGRVPV